MAQRWLSTILSLFLCLWLHSALASPAVPGLLTFKHADGEQFTAHLKGDEWFSWLETGSGHVAIRTEAGNYEFVRLQNGQLRPSGLKAHGRTPADNSLLRADNAQFRSFLATRPRPERGAGRPAAPRPASGAPMLEPGQGRNHGAQSVWNDVVAPPPTVPLLVVILEFNDQHLRSPVSAWHQKIFGNAAGQMNYFWNTLSEGRFRFTPATETQGTANDGIMKVALPINHPNLGRAVGTTERYTALNQLDGFINYASYDLNGDHVLSRDELQIIYLYAGGESATGSSLPSVWAHMTSDFGVFHDGVELRNNYARFGERHFSPPNDHDATFGIIAHELGHSAFDLPDLYDYDGSSSGVGAFCLMGSGNWNGGPNEEQGASPSPVSAWVRYRLGFSAVEDVVPGTPLNQSIKPVSRQGAITLIPTSRPHEYFLVENRYPETLDIGLTGYGDGGAFIWHIDEAMASNTEDARRLVDLEGNDTLGQYFWPATGMSRLDDSSTPNSRSNDGSSTGVKVTSLRRVGDADHSVAYTAEKTYPTLYPSMNFRGTPNNWGSTPMRAVAANTWETTQTFAAGVSNPRFKFDVNGDWATNFGDTNRDGRLEQNGADIPAPATAGTYAIRLLESTMSYTVTRVNQPPIANAGPDQIVLINQSVTLDGSASRDPDGSIAGYQWSNGLSGVRPTITYSSAGIRIVTLTVTDNQGATARDDVVVDVRTSLPNQLPVARIAPVTGARVGQAVTFDGSASSDPDGQISSYSWTISSVAGTLSGARPSYTFATAGSYTVSLTVTDNRGGQNTSSITVPVSSSFNKVYPQVYWRGTSNGWGASLMDLTANNTWSKTIVVPSTGAHTFKFDVYGDWSLNFGDTNADGLAEQNGSNIAFPAGGGTFVVSFNDSSKRYTVTRQGSNQPPVVVVAPPQTISGARTVTLNGSGSYDPDGQITGWLWTQTAGPTVSISNATQASASVALPAVSTTTTWRFSLRVTDNQGATASAEQVITANPQSCTPTYTRMHLRGTNNAWGSSAMALASDCNWEIRVPFGSTTTERFKFDVNADWAVNFGDSNVDGIAEPNGADINVRQGAGTYLVRFNDTSKRYSVTKQ